ncbi:cell cycle regulator of non-homologous end joining isoform X1 [Ailuropoda melanoleuca]|uniref:cell cycle regulator of non-homologous end joining isoform X1 n=1 Tax=Ailuropoda melanoleuca TaxID=9646 RepID=UPI001494A9E4|nr:cell cycle regulator of non-homologous end joining isoform X1 [Ailuropoda melanoleuca]
MQRGAGRLQRQGLDESRGAQAEFGPGGTVRPPDQQQASPGPGMDADGASCLQGARRVSGRAAARAGSALAARGGAGSPPPPGAVSPARPGSQELRVSPGGGKPGWRIACSGLSSAQPPASRGPRASERACGRPPSRASRVSRGQPGLACKPTCSPSALAPRRNYSVTPIQDTPIIPGVMRVGFAVLN